MNITKGMVIRCEIKDTSCKMHILEIIDEQQVVFKYFKKSLRKWIYEIEPFHYFKIREEYLTDVTP